MKTKIILSVGTDHFLVPMSLLGQLGELTKIQHVVKTYQSAPKAEYEIPREPSRTSVTLLDASLVERESKKEREHKELTIANQQLEYVRKHNNELSTELKELKETVRVLTCCAEKSDETSRA